MFTIHKLIGDLPNVSREWYDETIQAEGMSDAHYIELMGVLTHVWSIDEFHRALAIKLEPLPDPLPGEPMRRRPEGLADHGSWPPTVLPKDLAESEADIYGGARHTPNVRAAMSLHPDSVRWLNDMLDAHYRGGAEPGPDMSPSVYSVQRSVSSSLPACRPSTSGFYSNGLTRHAARSEQPGSRRI